MSPTPPAADWLKIVFDFISLVGAWFLVVLGWMVVSDQEAQRELARSAQTRLHDLRKMLRETADLAITHHTGGFDAIRQREMVRNVGRIAAELSHLRRSGLVGDEGTKLVIAFRKAVTYENDSEFSYRAKMMGTTFLDDIDTAADALDRFLMSAGHTTILRKRSLRDSVRDAVKRL
jgi:hypothetical protein